MSESMTSWAETDAQNGEVGASEISAYADAETQVMSSIAHIEDVVIPELMKGLPSEAAKARVHHWRRSRWPQTPPAAPAPTRRGKS